MLGFELRAKKWQRHGDSENVEPFRYEPNSEVGAKDYFCCNCNHNWKAHGMLKRSGEILCPGSWVLTDYDDVIDEGESHAN